MVSKYHSKKARTMKKYTIFNLILAIFFLAFSYSCSEDWLDRSPSDGLPKDDAISNFDDAFVALNGMYDAIQGSNSSSTYSSIHYTYYGARMIYYGDVRADDMQPTEAATRVSPSYNMNYTLSTAPQIWEMPYIVISRANNLIANIDAGKLEDATDEEKNDIKGQALMARALAHFDLLRVYSQPYFVSGGTGLGIPIVTSPQDATFVPSRNTIEEVYTQVITDITESINLMLSDRSSKPYVDYYQGNTGYFNTWAAKALLARVYLYKGDNAKAYETAVDIINNSGYKLWSTTEYVSAWSKAGTSEVLFEIVNASNDDWVDRESIGYLYSEDGYNEAIMTKAFVDLMGSEYPNDVRNGVMLGSVKVEDPSTLDWGTSKVYINKYPGREGSGDVRVNNVPILRLSETYLIAAEAAAKLSDQANAAKYLNAIVLRGNPDATAVTESEATVDRILQERRVEFVGEGHRFFDLMRNNKTVTRYVSDDNRGWHLALIQDSRSFDVNYFRAILPIPVAEMSANPNIQQNPNY